LYLLQKGEVEVNENKFPTYRISISSDESMEISSRLMGAYLLVSSIGQYKNTKSVKYALAGKRPGKDYNYAVINEGSDYPLTLAGRTKIIGDIKAGIGGVTKGEIEGEYFQGDSLNDGRIVTSNYSGLLDYNFGIINKYLSEIVDRAGSPDRYIDGSLVLDNESFRDLEKESIIVIENQLEISSDKPIIASRPITLISKGNVIIKGGSRIAGLFEIVIDGYVEIQSDAIVEGLTLVASDSIIIGSGALVSAQAICGGSIYIKEMARISYPSLLYIYDDGNSANPGQIVFNLGSKSECIAIAEDSISQLDLNPNSIVIQPLAKVNGIVESEGFLEIQGQLYGIAISSNFLYKTEKSLYINWLCNTNIDRNQLDFIAVLPINNSKLDSYGLFKKY